MAILHNATILAIVLTASIISSSALQFSVNRRDWLLGSAATCSSALIANSVLPASASQYCASGIGDGCNDLAEGNDFIKTLQEKSAANKDKYTKEALNAYYMKNYPDFFASSGKKLVRKPDGSFILLDEAEIDRLSRANKLSTEMPRALKGRVTDLTQKPILVLKE
ncbi:hypothetical protein MPSEU_000835400 [Mayamaea pseudoterrestris]|nr:hypothetical protein MPSEU_000835400 [Mayamaea pseudoterrestris]